MVANSSFFFAIFLCILHTITADEGLGAPSGITEFAEFISKSELVGPSMSDVRIDLQNYKEWRYTAVHKDGRRRLRLKAPSYSLTVLKQSVLPRSSRKVKLPHLNETAVRQSSNERIYMTITILLPQPDTFLNEILLFTATDQNMGSAHIFSIAWRNYDVLHDGSCVDCYVLFIGPHYGGEIFNDENAYFLGNRIENQEATFTMHIDGSNLSVEINGMEEFKFSGILDQLQSVECSDISLAVGIDLLDDRAMWLGPSEESVVYFTDMSLFSY